MPKSTIALHLNRSLMISYLKRSACELSSPEATSSKHKGHWSFIHAETVAHHVKLMCKAKALPQIPHPCFSKVMTAKNVRYPTRLRQLGLLFPMLLTCIENILSWFMWVAGEEGKVYLQSGAFMARALCESQHGFWSRLWRLNMPRQVTLSVR